MKPKVLLKMTSLALMVHVNLLAVPPAAANAEEPAKPSPAVQSMALDSLEGLEIRAVSEIGAEPVKVKADITTYHGRRALHVVNDDATIGSRGPSGGESLAIVKGSDLQDGTIEVDLVARPRQGSNTQSRGFVGIAFRIQGDVEKFEYFYLCFTNGRAADQLRRKPLHTIQFFSRFSVVPFAGGESRSL